MLTVAADNPARPKASPLRAALAAHRRAVFAANADPENDALADAVIEAEEVLAEAPCASDAEFIEKLSYLLGALRTQWGREPYPGDGFETIAHAAAIYLDRRKSA